MSEGARGEIRVLYVDNDPVFTDVVSDVLEREFDSITVETETTASTAVSALTDSTFDCVVSEFELPDKNGLELLDHVRRHEENLPFILFTDDGTEKLASDAISAGVTDYLRKGQTATQYTELTDCIERAVGNHRATIGRGESDRMLSTLIGNLPGMVYRCRNERGWPMEFVSEGCAELTGYSAAALERGDIGWESDVLHPDDRDRLWETVQRAIESSRSFKTTYRIRTRNGAVRWCWERGSGVFEGGELVALEGFITDITEQKRREEQLEQYRTLVENVGDPMYVLDENGSVVVTNDAMANHLGYERGDIVGERVETFIPPEAVERGDEIIRELLAEDDANGWRLWRMDAIRADGTRFRNENKTAVVYDDEGEFAGSVGVIRDISDRLERERELERYETVVEAVGDPVYALDEAGRFTFINDAIEEMAGYEADALQGAHIDTIVRPEDVKTGTEHIASLLGDPDSNAVTFEVVVETAGGETIPCELHMALLPTEDGEFRGTAGVLRDIEGRKQREQRLEEFASVVSHDLRGPLNVIRGRTSLAKETGDVAHLDAVEDATERMEGLIDGLLTLARQGEAIGSVESVELEPIVTAAWNSVDNATATLDNRASLVLEADPDRLQELFENLFRNAIEHGRSETDSAALTVGTLSDCGFYVADTGSGIAPDERETVFERGYTTTDNGTGFGLSIVKRIADAHGWETTLTDSASGGARFEFRV
jgi:PAS domain S-box-containing protein